jgi:hypothetical protein
VALLKQNFEDKPEMRRNWKDEQRNSAAKAKLLSYWRCSWNENECQHISRLSIYVVL